MILNIGGKALAFGMHWQILVRGQAPGREARAAKSPLMWVDSAREYFGILSADEVVPKGSDKVYSAAQALLNIPQSSTNMLLVLRDPDTAGYLVCGVMQKRPRNGFDAAHVDDAQLGELLARFTDLCGPDGFELLGDAPLDGISALSIADLIEAADEHCLLRSSGSVARFVPWAAFGVVAIGLIIFGVHHHRKSLADENAANKKTPAQQYAESLSEHAKAPTFPTSRIDAWATWAESLPPNVGGWTISSVGCNVSAPQSQFSCVLAYKRGPAPLATNRTFVDASPKDWKDNIQFIDDKTIQVALAEKLPLVPTSAVIREAVSPRLVSLDFGSTLQRLVNVSKKTALSTQYDLFGLPVGMVPATVPSPVLFTSWSLEGPFRLLDAVREFPAYSTIEHINMNVTRGGDSSANSSIVMIAVSGSVYAKQ